MGSEVVTIVASSRVRFLWALVRFGANLPFQLPAESFMPVYVFGHRNPDTDAICSALAYADFLTTHHAPGCHRRLLRDAESAHGVRPS